VLRAGLLGGQRIVVAGGDPPPLLAALGAEVVALDPELADQAGVTAASGRGTRRRRSGAVRPRRGGGRSSGARQDVDRRPCRRRRRVVRDDPAKTTVAPEGYLALPSGSRLAFEPSSVSVVAVQPHAGDDRAEALARLDRLREDGALSEGEFEAAKRRLEAALDRR
jgi:hypothetical protein